MKVGDLVRRRQDYLTPTGKIAFSERGPIGIIVSVDKDMVKIANQGWWSKHFTEVISESR